MDLTALRIVVAVADHLHFGQAAEALDTSQPQVSQRVKRIENQLGLQIFVREHHRISVTDAGAAIVAHAREVVAAADRLDRVAADWRSGVRGIVRLGVVGSAFFGALPALRDRLGATAADLSLEISEMESPEQEAALAEGRIDVGLLRPPAPGSLSAHTVWSEPLVVALSDQNPLGRLDVVPTHKLVDQPLILFPRDAGPGYWDVVAALHSDVGIAMKPAVEADHVTTMLGQASLGLGYTVVPSTMTSVGIPGLVFRPVEPTRNLDLAIVHKHPVLSPAVRRLVDALVEGD